MNQLSSLRKKLDKVDQKIVSQLVKRKDLVAEIAAYKIKNNLPIRDPIRERQLIVEKISSSQGQLDPDLVKRLFQLIIKYSRRQQEKLLK